ncbi:tripartite tricarboxylate transporter substrate binding protein [Bosea sp. (in: a-proteobacteria)]|uniref:tripartite tricarboxylate transporter substrate binding protein n=1 Tax=Bosea sp. (in: a-proteobacteria) TaxID=1871050 RepID=UPI002FC938EC
MTLKTLMLAATFAATAFSASAAWPERPITLLVPWAAGGGTDAVARILAAGLEKELGKPVNVVNRTGGGGVVGHTEIVNAKPDGYTIGLATAEVTTYYWSNTAPFTYEKLTPIALVNFDSAAFNVAANSPWANLRAALDDIRKQPVGHYKLSGMAAGAAYHLAFAGLLQLEGINPKSVTVVPSQGAAPGFQELASGGVQIVPSSLPEGKPMFDAGRVKALAVMSKDKISAFPTVPTVKDAIGKEYEGGTWRGLAAPAGIPADIAARLVEATEKVATSDLYKNFLAERGFGYAFAKGPVFGEFLAKQHKQNSEIMEALGLRLRK